MNTLRRLFGVSAEEIKEDVIITPFLNVEYFAHKTKFRKTKGFLFEVLTQKELNVIKTGVGASFVGDAVLYLKETPCRRLYFIGSCAGLLSYEVGDIILVERAFAGESFSELLQKNAIDKNSCVIPEKNLADEFLKFCHSVGKYKKCFTAENSFPTQQRKVMTSPQGEEFSCAQEEKEGQRRNQRIHAASVATLGSLSLQSALFDSFMQQGIGGVDMEVSAFFSAANCLKRPCLALLYVTDTVTTKSFFRNLTNEERKVIQTSRQQTIGLVCDFIRQQSA